MKYVAIGRLHPERADIRFSEVSWESPDGKISASCDSSQISVYVNDPRCDGHVSAFLTAEHFASTVASCLGMSLATSYSVELIQLIDGDKTHVFGTRVNGLEHSNFQSVFLRALELSRSDLFFRFAVRDYNSALNSSVDCAFLCYRAIEGIKCSFSAADPAGGWRALHEALGTTQESIRSTIKVFADPVRHGNWVGLPATSSAQRYAMLALTKSVLDSYMDHRLGVA